MRRLAQHALDVHEPEVAAGGGLERRPADVHGRGERGGELGAPHVRERLGDRGLGGEDHGFGGHHAAGGALLVGEQAPDVVRLARVHEAEELLGLVAGQLGEQVGGVVGLHRLEHVGGALAGELGEDLDLVVLGELLEDVGEALVVEGRGDLEPPLRRQLVHHLGQVGGLELVERRQQVRGALPLLHHAEPLDVLDVDEQGLAAAAEPVRPAAPHEQLGQAPVAAPAVLDRDVLDRDLLTHGGLRPPCPPRGRRRTPRAP